MIANYLPLQDPYGGPNYFKMDPNAVYEIHVDNVGDAKEHITFQFRFTNTSKGKTLPINGTEVAIPLTQFGQVTDGTGATLNVTEAYTLDDDQRRPSHERQVRDADQRHRGGRRRGDDDVRQAVRQHRHEDDSRLCGLRRPSSSTRSPFRAARRRARCSSASARTRSRSTSGRSSTSSTSRTRPSCSTPTTRTLPPMTSRTRTSPRSRSKCRPRASSAAATR